MVKNITSKEKQALKVTLFFLLFAFIFSVSTAFASAGGATPEVTPEFEDAVTDLTNKHSNSDYGQQIINWISFGKPDNVKFGDKSLLSTISFSLNAIALVMMAYLSLLGGLTYIIQTANKGTPGGQVISSFWMPIRIASATILLVPLASGYSTIQYGVITVAEKGNAHGSYLMDQGIDYIAANGVYRPPAMESSKEVVYGLIFSELCKSHIDTKENRTAVNIVKTGNNLLKGELGATQDTLRMSYDKFPAVDKSGNFIVSFFKSLIPSFPKRGYCGELTIDTPDADIGAFRKGTAAQTSKPYFLFSSSDYEDDGGILATEELIKYIEGTVIPKARDIAKKLNSDGVELRKLQKKGGEAAQSTYERNQKSAEKNATGLASEINKMIVDYDNEMQKIVQSTVMKINKRNSTKGAGGSTTTNKESSGEAPWVKQVKEAGWPALGAVFWQISKNQEATNYLAKRIKATHTEPKMDAEYENDEQFMTLYARLGELIKSAKDEKKSAAKRTFDMSSIKFAGSDGSAGEAKSKFTGMFQGLMMALFIPEDDGDLITKLQYSGSVLVSVTDLISNAAMIGDAVGRTTVSTSESTFLGQVIAASAAPLAGAATGTAATILGRLVATPVTLSGNIARNYAQFASTLVIPLLIAGFALAVVLPAIPLFFWLMGVLSWMLFYVECLLISPMWLAAHGTADKDGWGTEHTRQGYMLMIGLYLNPILRVAGFFAIFLVLIPLGKMISWLSEYLTGIVSSGWLSPVMIVGSMVILAVFAYSAAVRVFSLPNELFERGLRWVNGGQEVTGDSGAEQQNRMIIAQVGGKAQSAASEAKSLGRATPKPTPESK